MWIALFLLSLRTGRAISREGARGSAKAATAYGSRVSGTRPAVERAQAGEVRFWSSEWEAIETDFHQFLSVAKSKSRSGEGKRKPLALAHLNLHLKSAADLVPALGMLMALYVVAGYPSERNIGREQDVELLGKVPRRAVVVAIITPAIHYCRGGLEIDVESACLGQSGNPIPSLFAPGEVAGAVHGNNRLGGNSLLDCVVFGRALGLYCAQYMLGDDLKETSLKDLFGGGLVKSLT